MNTGWGERNASSMALGASTRAADTTDEILLAATAVSKRFGGVRAVEDVSIAVKRGAIASIIGPNGAGKTSFLNMISGFYRPDSGSITFEGRDITRARPPRSDEGGRPGVLCLLGPGAEGRGEAPRPRRRADRLSRIAGSAQAADQRTRLRPAQAGRAGARAGARSHAALARRADGRDEPGRKRRHGPLHHRRERAMGHDDHPH